MIRCEIKILKISSNSVFRPANNWIGGTVKRSTSIIMATILGSMAVSASPISLDPSTLPSHQGWKYLTSGLHAGTTESAVFSTTGSHLTMNSMDHPVSASTGGSAIYRKADVITASMQTTLEWESRIVEYEKDSRAPGQDFGFCAGFSSGSLHYSVGISSDKIVLFDGSGVKHVPLDTSEFHAYRISAIAESPSYEL